MRILPKLFLAAPRFGRGRAIHYKSSHALRRGPGFPFLSLAGGGNSVLVIFYWI